MNRLLLILLTSFCLSCTPVPDAKKLGLTPAQAREYEKNIAEGDTALITGIVVVIVGVLALAVGLWYQFVRKKNS